MAAPSPTKRLSDSVRKINNELAVGEDLDFQRRWWKFENGVWIFFALIVLLDLAGAFGRGPLAKAHAEARDGSLSVQYERIECFSTPSRLRVEFGPTAIHDGKVQLWASESLLKSLGNQRVSPEPALSQVGDGGVLYTFKASKLPASAELSLQPLSPGSHFLDLRVPGAQELKLKIFVMPLGSAVYTIIHAIAGYFFLLLTVRVLSRRPGAQMTLFEFVIVFLMGASSFSQPSGMTTRRQTAFALCLRLRSSTGRFLF